MTQSEQVRDVRTMLLCKAHGHHNEVYKRICDVRIGGSNRQSYFTVGTLDAIVIYKLDMGQRSADGVSRDWLERLLEDKQDVSLEMSSEVSYHPFHLVSNLESPSSEREGEFHERREKIERFWRTDTMEKLPFLVITMVYVSNPGLGQNETYEDRLWKSLADCENEHCQLTVYNSVNLCDLVVLWRTDRLSETLRKTMNMRLRGDIRKTYQFMNIPMTKEGLSPAAHQSLCQEDVSCPILIRGAIRDDYLFHKEIYQPLFRSEEQASAFSYGGSHQRKGRKDPLLDAQKAHFSYGENDFLIMAQI